MCDSLTMKGLKMHLGAVTRQVTMNKSKINLRGIMVGKASKMHMMGIMRIWTEPQVNVRKSQVVIFQFWADFRFLTLPIFRILSSKA